MRGFGLKRGAIAATTNCDNQNLVVVGVTDDDIALRRARDRAMLGGGFVAVADGEVLATVPLPVAGCMSDQPWEVVRDQSLAGDAAAAVARLRDARAVHDHVVHRARGVPDLGLTEIGLLDTATADIHRRRAWV